MATTKDSKINNTIVVANSNDPHDHITKEENVDKKQTTGTGLSLSMEKLNLCLQKKLLVLPIGGFLVFRSHRCHPNVPKNRHPDFWSGNFMIYKRPFCEEFLKFCFERFEVGVWFSGMEHDISKVLINVMGELKSKLLFTWDQTQCTETNFKFRDVRKKQVLLKELKHIWRKYDGKYSASNTLLTSDLVKALANPPNTAISLGNYDPENKEDDLLGPDSELRVFLKGLAEANDVQDYVKDHPIGDPPITPAHPDWDFYSKIMHAYGKNN